MANIIDTAATVGVVGSFNIVAAHVGSFRADVLANGGGAVGLAAVVDLVEATVGHEAGEFHVLIHRLVDGLDAVGVVNSELGIIGGLDGFVDNAVDYAEGVKVELDALVGAVGDELVLVVEVVVKGGAVVTAVGLGEEVERLDHLALPLYPVVELRKSAQESLEDVPGCNGGKLSSVQNASISNGVTAINWAKGRVLILSSERVDAPRGLLLVRKSSTQWLRKEQHVRLFAP